MKRLSVVILILCASLGWAQTEYINSPYGRTGRAGTQYQNRYVAPTRSVPSALGPPPGACSCSASQFVSMVRPFDS